MQFTMRLTSCRVVLILLLSVAALVVHAQEAVQPVAPPLNDPLSPKVVAEDVKEPQQQGSVSTVAPVQTVDSPLQVVTGELIEPPLPSSPTKIETEPALSQSGAAPVTMPLLVPQGLAPETTDRPVGGFENPAQNLVDRPLDIVPQASRIDPAAAVPQSSSVNPMATSVMEQPVQPAGFNRSLGRTGDAVDSQALDLGLAREMMSQYDLMRSSSELPGEPVTLLESLRTTRVAYRSDMIHQYWKTHSDWVMLQTSMEYQKWLQQISRPSTPAERVLLSAARNEAESRVLSREIQLGISQQRLQELVGRPDDRLPLPSDSPLIKAYQTHYEWFSSRNLVPTHLRGINQRLPRQLKLISQQAETIRIAKSAMNQTRAAFAAGQLDVAAVLEAGRLWRSGSHDLVETVAQYNQSIADYATTIHPNFRSADEIVAMLISRPITNRPGNAVESFVDNSQPVARTADSSVQQSIVPNAPVRSSGLNPAVQRNVSPATGLLAPRSLLPPSGLLPSAPTTAAPVSRNSVLEPAGATVAPQRSPASAQSPPENSSGNGFSLAPPARPQLPPAVKPSKSSTNGFDPSSLGPPPATPPAKENNSFGGGSFGGS